LLHENDGIWQSQLDDISFDYNELRVPTKVAAVIAQRISRLSEAASRTLQAASVIRQGFAPKMLSNIIGLSELATFDALEEAQNSSLIATDSFLHDLIRQSVYQSLPDARRRFLHGKVASILENIAEPLVVAEHWLEADETHRAIPKLREAADLYQQRGIHNEAVKVLDSAINLMPNDAVRLETQLMLATVLYQVDRFEDAQKLVDLILPNCKNPLLKLKLLNLQVDILMREDRIPEVLPILQQAVRMTESLFPNELDQNARTIKGKLAFIEGNFEQALKVYEIEFEHLQHNSYSLDFAENLSDMGAIYERLGDFERSLSFYQHSFDIAKTLGARHIQVSTACGILNAHIKLQRSENGIQLGEEMLELGWYRDSDTLRNNLVVAYNLLGFHDDVMRHSEIMAQESPDPRFRAAAWSRMAKIYPESERLKIEKALEHALEILELVFDHAALASVALNVVSLGNKIQRAQAFQHLERVNVQMISQNSRERLVQALNARVTS
jgi:tetratricopeptide (TPR) repeat protein